MSHVESNTPFFNLLGGLKAREAALKKLANNINEKERILDLATGSGYLVRNLTTKNAFIVCLDFDIKPLKKTKNELPELNYVRGDALHLPFKKSSFDHVISWSALVHIENWKGVIKEAFRVTNNVLTAEPEGEFQVRAFRDFNCKHKSPGKKELQVEFEKYGRTDIEKVDFITIFNCEN